MIGLATGLCARWLFLKDAPGGLPLALLLGTAGSMFAAFLTQQFGPGHNAPAMQLVAMIGGAAVLLFGYRLDLGQQAGRRPSSSPDLKLHP